MNSASASPALTHPAPTNLCPQCGAQFRCGMEGGDKECWCASLPALLPLSAKSDPGSPAPSCLCPACLKARLVLAAEVPASK